MNFFGKQTTLIAFLMITVSAVQSQLPVHKIAYDKCVMPLLSGDSVLTDSIKKYLRNVGNYEIPIVAIQILGDTTHYFISGFISTYSIRRNPPSAIVKLANREGLLYTGKSSIATTAPECYQYLLKKYTQILKADIINRRDGRSNDKPQAYLYDPVLAHISVAKDGHITTNLAKRFPFIKYE